MEFTAKDVMALRERSGAGMMDCKKALKECDGDIEKALDYLREKSLAASAKKASRIAAEGIVDCFVCEICGVGVIIEVNCETDVDTYVHLGGKIGVLLQISNNEFPAVAHDVAMQIAAAKPTCLRKEDCDHAEL